MERDGEQDELQELFDQEADGILDDRTRLDELLAQPENRARWSAWTRTARTAATLSGARPSRDFSARVMERLGEASAPHDPLLARFVRWWTAPRMLAWNPLAAGVALAALVALALLPGRFADPPAAPEAARVHLVWYGDARKVTVAGSFNDWSADAMTMAQVRPGVWAVDLSVPRGTHEYAFVVDGERWIPDPSAPVHVEDGFGQMNARLEI